MHDEREYHPTMDWTQVSVSVDDEHVNAIDEVADQLRERGMRVDRVLQSVGIVTGSAQDVTALSAVPGVLSVDPEQRFDIGPPDQEIQ